MMNLKIVRKDVGPSQIHVIASQRSTNKNKILKMNLRNTDHDLAFLVVQA